MVLVEGLKLAGKELTREGLGATLLQSRHRGNSSA
jgi:hypothetical protein